MFSSVGWRVGIEAPARRDPTTVRVSSQWFLDLAESVPFAECIAHYDNNNQHEDQCSRLRNVHQRVADVTYNKYVDMIADLDRPDRWQWELSGIEG